MAWNCIFAIFTKSNFKEFDWIPICRKWRRWTTWKFLQIQLELSFSDMFESFWAFPGLKLTIRRESRILTEKRIFHLNFDSIFQRKSRFSYSSSKLKIITSKLLPEKILTCFFRNEVFASKHVGFHFFFFCSFISFARTYIKKQNKKHEWKCFQTFCRP